jgi:hypothetical protein
VQSNCTFDEVVDDVPGPCASKKPFFFPQRCYITVTVHVHGDNSHFMQFEATKRLTDIHGFLPCSYYFNCLKDLSGYIRHILLAA